MLKRRKEENGLPPTDKSVGIRPNDFMKLHKDFRTVVIILLLLIGLAGILSNISKINGSNDLFYKGYKNVDLVHNFNVVSNEWCEGGYEQSLPFSELSDTGLDGKSISLTDWYRIGMNQIFNGFSEYKRIVITMPLYFLLIGVAMGMIISGKGKG